VSAAPRSGSSSDHVPKPLAARGGFMATLISLFA